MKGHTGSLRAVVLTMMYVTMSVVDSSDISWTDRECLCKICIMVLLQSSLSMNFPVGLRGRLTVAHSSTDAVVQLQTPL